MLIKRELHCYNQHALSIIHQNLKLIKEEKEMGSNNNVKSCLILLAIVLSANFLQSIGGCIIVKHVTVHVFDGLPGNSSPLNVHCKSGDDDLGIHTIVGGQDYSFDFCESFFQNTLFTCNLRWGVLKTGFQAFNSEHPKDCRSGTCVWVAYADGIYFGDGDASYLNKKYNWQWPSLLVIYIFIS